MIDATPSGIVVTMAHVRRERLCASGVRGWFAQRDHALLRTFCRDGLPVETVEAFGDAFAQRIAKRARADALEAGNGR
jgi:hypothetical protein